MEGTRDGRSWRSLYEGRAAKVWSGRTWLAAACCCALVGLPLLVGDVRVARAAGSGYAAAVLADHPVGYWRFGEAAGASTAVDASGHGINGTYVGGPTLAVAGALSGDTDTAVRFNGAAGQYVSFGNNFGMAATQPFSVEVWVRPDSIPSATFAVLAEKFNAGTPQTSGYKLSLNSGFGFCLERWVNGVHNGSCTYGHVVTARWYHVVATYNGSTTLIYLDGTSGNPLADASSIPVTTGPFTMADSSVDTQGGDAFAGTLDEGAVYAVALSQARIRAHYYAGLPTSGSDFGYQKRFTVPSEQLTDALSLGVNVASGNLTLRTHDIHFEGVAGFDLDVGRVYNSLVERWGTLGAGWQFDTGADVRLDLRDDGAIGYDAPDGARYVFVPGGIAGTYVTPTGLDTTLIKNADGTYKLSDDAGGTKALFSSAGLLTAVASKNDGGTTSVRIGFSYDASGNVTTITDTHGHQLTASYNSWGRIAQLTDQTGAGRSWLYGYGANLNFTKYTDATGAITQFGYDAKNALTSITDPRGSVTQIGYDSQGRVSSIVRGLNASGVCQISGLATCPTSTFTYNSGSTVVTDPNGHQTTYSVDSRSRVTAVTDADAHTHSVSYTDPGGLNCADDSPCSITDARSKTTSFGYNAAGTFTPTAGENLLFSQSPLEGTTNRPSFAYANASHPFYLSQYTDPQAHSWTYNYDENTGNSNGNLTSGGATGQIPVKFTYNPDGTVATATDAKNNVTTYGYNAVTHDLTTITPPAPLGATSLTYDNLDRVKTVSDGKGQIRTYTYDKLDRVTQTTFTGGPTLTFNYDGDGNLGSTIDPTGTYTYTLDALNRVTQQAAPQADANVSYGYDPASNLTGVTDPGGTTSYGYDPANLLATLSEPGAATPIRFAYDANNNRTQIQYPNGVFQCLGYDDAQRLISAVAQTLACAQTGTPLTKFTYTYANGAGSDSDLRQSMLSQYPGQAATTTSYCYDPLNRLQSADGVAGCPNANAAFRYVYDGNGNISSKTTPSGPASYTYNNANELTNSGYSFDANGSQTAAPGIFSSAGYNLLDQTSTITPTGHAALSLSYQGLAQAHRVGAGAITYANDQLGLNEETGSPETEYIRDSNGVILGERINTSHYYFLFDGLGSVTAATDSTGTIVRTFAYDPYGNTTSSTGTIYEPIRYAGGYLDTHPDGNGPSLYKFGQRYYDPTSGRWTQPDPLNNPLALHGWNGYDYAGDDPINSIDPSGMGAVSPCVSIKYRETHRQCLHRNGNCKVGKALVGIGVVGVGSLIGVLHIVAGASEIAGGAAEGGVGEIVAGPIGAAEVIKGGGFIASSVTVGGYLIHQSHC